MPRNATSNFQLSDLVLGTELYLLGFGTRARPLLFVQDGDLCYTVVPPRRTALWKQQGARARARGWLFFVL